MDYEVKMVEKLKFIFLSFFLFLIFVFGLRIFPTHFYPNRNSSNLLIEKSVDNKQVWAEKIKIYKTKIWMTLYFLSQLEEDKIEFTIKNEEYSITELIKKPILIEEYSAMSLGAQKEIDNLCTDEIDNRTLIVNSGYKEKLLSSFLKSIHRDVWEKFVKVNMNEITIDRTAYKIGNLIRNYKKGVSGMLEKSQTELMNLFVDQINGEKLLNARMNSFFETIKPALKLFATVKITEVQIGENLHRISNLIANLDKTYSKLPGWKAKSELRFLIIDTSDQKVYERLISIYKKTLDFFLEDIKPVLQVFLSTEININNKIYQIGHLTTNLNQKGSELVGNAKTELMKLFIDKINGQKLTTLLSSKLKLDVFFEPIKSSLQSLFDMDIIAVIINGKVYPIGNLTTNLDKKGSELVDQAKDQLLVLYNYDFNFKTIIEKFKENLINHKTALDNYKNEIQSTLQNLASAKIEKIEIDGTTYQLNFLLQDVNLQLVGYKLLQNAKKQLLYLMGGNITKTLLADALTTILKTRVAETTILQTQKKQNQKKLIIGLSIAGVVLTLSAFGGGLYWFFKIKK